MANVEKVTSRHSLKVTCFIRLAAADQILGGFGRRQPRSEMVRCSEKVTLRCEARGVTGGYRLRNTGNGKPLPVH